MLYRSTFTTELRHKGVPFPSLAQKTVMYRLWFLALGYPTLFRHPSGKHRQHDRDVGHDSSHPFILINNVTLVMFRISFGRLTLPCTTLRYAPYFHPPSVTPPIAIQHMYPRLVLSVQ
ncbi:Hypothetical predicted protein [Pelobates cultripes]|uniref:Uncharacterized protein n=1 Tax=Pelobates cultripes TaxID=61616 RepID=A0AAD1RZ59_PELCU|nr:Hypothetical predicted protein [Pelobates cultripes]